MALKELSHKPRELGERLVDRLGLLGLVLASAVLVAADFVLSLRPVVSLAFTATQTLLVLPWLYATTRLGARDLPRRQNRRLLSDRAARALLAGTALFLALCLYQKWTLVLAVRQQGTADPHAYRLFTVAAYVFAQVGLLVRGARFRRMLAGLSVQPARLTALSFALAGLLGALVLSFPEALQQPGRVSFLDSLFVAVSAVCVTGLTVHSIAATYTVFGQAVIFVLFQVGALGIMALSAAFAMMAGHRLRAQSRAMLAEMVDARSVAALKQTILGIVLYTLALEALGALVLFGLFSRALPHGATGDVVWAAVFHSVSAFCNAGFSTFADGLMPFDGDWGVSSTMMALIVLGGLGFPVLHELGEQLRMRARRQRRAPRLSLHARVVLVTSGLLVGAVALAILPLEWTASQASLPWHTRLLTALFQSVTARTAGFNTLPIGDLGAPTLMMLCMVMFVGASPGSTGGGVKTTTMAVMYATFRAELRGRPRTTLLDRSLGEGITRRAVGVFFLSTLMVSVMTLLLLIVEDLPPLQLTFEAVSAFATVGLSTGVTGSLSPAGKWVLIATMLIGRIGPMTLALALSARRAPVSLQLPEETVTIG